MMRLKLIHVRKRGPWNQNSVTVCCHEGMVLAWSTTNIWTGHADITVTIFCFHFLELWWLVMQSEEMFVHRDKAISLSMDMSLTVQVWWMVLQGDGQTLVCNHRWKILNKTKLIYMEKTNVYVDWICLKFGWPLQSLTLKGPVKLQAELQARIFMRLAQICVRICFHFEVSSGILVTLNFHLLHKFDVNFMFCLPNCNKQINRKYSHVQ